MYNSYLRVHLGFVARKFYVMHTYSAPAGARNPHASAGGTSRPPHAAHFSSGINLVMGTARARKKLARSRCLFFGRRPFRTPQECSRPARNSIRHQTPSKSVKKQVKTSRVSACFPIVGGLSNTSEDPGWCTRTRPGRRTR